MIAKLAHAIYSGKYIADAESKEKSRQAKFEMKRLLVDSGTTRRRFIKFVTFGTATSLVSGKLWQREVLAYCEPIPDQPQGVFKVRVSDYPALTQSWGSVRIGVNPVTGGDPFPDGDFYPILINRDDGGKFYVLDCECRHQSCVVPPFNLADRGIHCQCHGSLYWIDGSVLNGPAASPLGAYQFEFDGNDTLTIHIQCWAFQVSATVLPSGPTSRIQIDFYGNTNVMYEVSFRERLDQPWTTAAFATTPSGPANQTSLMATGQDVSVYVDRSKPTGFYAVGMKLGQV
jgi:Rieske Fe-S protein